LLFRHDLLWLDEAAWAQALAERPNLAGIVLLKDWAARGWPVMVRRFAPGDDPGAVPVAVALPPAEPLRRIALQMPHEAISKRRPPLDLADIVPPAPWTGLMEGLLALGNECQVRPRIFGSLLWESLTGLGYVTPASDIDLIWPVTSPAPIRPLVAGLNRLERTSGVRLDGEIQSSDGEAVNWRELSGGATEVLVKSMTGVRLSPVGNWFSAPEHDTLGRNHWRFPSA